MLQFLTQLKNYSSITTRYCSFTCDLHYFYTRNLFICAFLLSGARQLFGDSIICCCVTAYPRDLINTNCFTNGTFTYVDSTPYYHYYYQWIPLVLLLESLAFSVPNLIWEYFVASYIKSLSIQNPKLDENYCNFIVLELRNTRFNFYLKHLLLDVTYLANVILQMYLLDLFLNNDYIDFFKYNTKNLFPLYTKCNFKISENSDYSYYKLECLLPLNILYEKIFKILWFWFHILLILQAIGILKRLIEMAPIKKGPLYYNTNKWFLYQIIKHNLEGENYWYVNKKLN